MYHLKMLPLTPSKKIQPLVSIKRCSPVLRNNVLQTVVICVQKVKLAKRNSTLSHRFLHIDRL